MASQRGESLETATPRRKGLDKSHYLYIAVIAAVVLGAVVGLLFPEVGKSLKPLGDGFVKLIKMMIAPVIFCTIVLGIGSIARQPPSARSAAWHWATSSSCQPSPWPSAWW
jgi:aerobic C4-dicarboxylate transport protein